MADDNAIFDLLQRFAASMIDKFEINDMLYELATPSPTCSKRPVRACH